MYRGYVGILENKMEAVVLLRFKVSRVLANDRVYQALGRGDEGASWFVSWHCIAIV